MDTDLERMARNLGRSEIVPPDTTAARRPYDVAPGESTASEGIKRFGTPVALPEFSFQARESQPIAIVGEAQVIAQSSGDLITFSVPPGRELRIKWIGFTSNDPTTLFYMDWQLLVDEVGFPGLNRLPVGLGLIHQPFEIDGRVEGGRNLVLRAFNTQPSSYLSSLIVVNLRGWLMREVR